MGFCTRTSEILASRKFIDAYNYTAASIVGRNPRDFFRAVMWTVGDIHQQLVMPV